MHCCSHHCAEAHDHHPRLSRRQFVSTLSAAGLGVLLGVRRSPAQAAVADEGGIIDTHHHIYPPRYTTANLKRVMEDSGALPASAYTDWSPQRALEQMDKAGVRSAVVSMTSPGIWWDNGEE